VLDWVAEGGRGHRHHRRHRHHRPRRDAEAIRPLFDKEIDGFSVVFHLVSYQSVGLSTLQSRALAGIVKGCFVFCLPGSNGAVKDGWDKVIAAQLDSRHGPCNMVELMPRLLET
jgi:molybdenum cofactor biosynthesis protein B